MPISSDRPAPYASTSVILDILNRNRARGLPSPIDKDVLGRAGVTDSIVPRTLAALQLLDLIDENGNHTDTLTGLRLAREEDYPARMTEWLNAAYADILKYVDPSQDNEASVRDAFRPYAPIGMQERMANLFIGLYSSAGVWTEKPQGKESGALRPRPQAMVVRRSTPKPNNAASSVNSGNGGHNPPPVVNGIHPALAGLLMSLPKNGDGWSASQRDGFVATFEVVLDFCYPVSTSTENKNSE